MYNDVRILARLTATWIAPTQPDLASAIMRWLSVLTASACSFLVTESTSLNSSNTGTVLKFYNHYIIQYKVSTLTIPLYASIQLNIGAFPIKSPKGRHRITLLHREYSDILTEKELEWLTSGDGFGAPQPPIAVSHILSALFLKAKCLRDIQLVEMERWLGDFDVSVGACERISRQSIPLCYTRHTSRFIISWLTFLPCALWAYTQWLTIPIMGVLSFLLVGIENISVQLEEPMSVLPLGMLAMGCRNAVEAVVASSIVADEIVNVLDEGKGVDVDNVR